MRVSYESPDLLVLDEVLDPEHLWKVWEYVSMSPTQPVFAGSPVSPWRMTDGLPYQGVQNAAAWPASGPPETPGGRTMYYPTQTALDLVLGFVLSQSETISRWVGSPGEDWDIVTACPFIYPQGSALSLHSDGGNQTHTGAYTFYVHPKWSVEWGGEFLAYEGFELPKTQVAAATTFRYASGYWDKHLPEDLSGKFVVPKPNRIVFVRGGTPHKVSRVEPAAGTHVRASINGFFLKDGSR